VVLLNINMPYAVILIFHIITACVTAIVITYALWVVVRSEASRYRMSALLLGFIVAIQVLTGTVLAIMSPELSAASLTLHIAVYLGACFSVELLLFKRMRRIFITFPAGLVISPAIASVMLFIVAISYGF